MPANAQVYQTTTVTTASVVDDTQTIVATLTGVAGNPYGQQIRVAGMVSITGGADVDEVIFTVRLNSISGAIIGATNTYAVVLASTVPLSVSALGTLPVGVHTVVVTVTCTGAATTSTINAVAITATVGN